MEEIQQPFDRSFDAGKKRNPEHRTPFGTPLLFVMHKVTRRQWRTESSSDKSTTTIMPSTDPVKTIFSLARDNFTEDELHNLSKLFENSDHVLVAACTCQTHSFLGCSSFLSQPSRTRIHLVVVAWTLAVCLFCLPLDVGCLFILHFSHLFVCVLLSSVLFHVRAVYEQDENLDEFVDTVLRIARRRRPEPHDLPNADLIRLVDDLESRGKITIEQGVVLVYLALR